MNNMERSFQPVEWNTEATGGMHTQVPIPGMLAAVQLHLLAKEVLMRSSFSGCLVAAAQFSGLEDQQLAPRIFVSQGYMSRFMRGVGEQWAKRVVLFMRATGSLAPLQWLAEQMGCDLIHRSAVSIELAAARARVAELERGAV